MSATTSGRSFRHRLVDTIYARPTSFYDDNKKRYDRYVQRYFLLSRRISPNRARTRARAFETKRNETRPLIFSIERVNSMMNDDRENGKEKKKKMKLKFHSTRNGSFRISSPNFEDHSKNLIIFLSYRK